MGFLAWLKEGPNHTKRAARYPQPGIAAYWWDGGIPTARDVKDISTTGAFLNTGERWYPGTILTVTLQEESKDLETADSASSVSLPCKVVRHGLDGVGVSFMFHDKQDRKALERFVRDVVVNGRECGQALVEFALVLPMLLLLMIYAVNFGGWLHSWITVANAARSAAQYASLGGASAGLPTPATATQIQSLVTTDASSLPSSVSVCVNTNNTTSAIAGTCSAFTIPAIPADPEAPAYASIAIDVKYTYPRFYNFTSFFRLPMARPSTTIQRRTVMRLLN
jgi:hypothetical protein